MIDQLVRLLDPIKRRILHIVGRGVVRLSTDGDGNQRYQVSLMAEETRDGVERIQEYGFTSRPLAGADAVVVFPGGNREFGLIVAVDDRRYRLKGLAEGEVALYTDEGDRIHLKRGGKIEISATSEVDVIASSKVVINSPAVEVGSGALEKALMGEAFQQFFNTHTHTSTSPGSPTSPPIAPSTAAHLSTVLKVKG